MNKRYFAYIRVSTVKQGERGSSLAEQKSAIEAYAARNSLTIVGWFEEMETAAKRGRRQFSLMMAELDAGKADGLIIHKIDRSARNLRDWADLGDLIDHGIDVRFVSDNFDLLSRGGRLSADIQAVVAADYIRNLRDEVKKGIYGRLKQGIYPFAAPMGYLNTGKGKVKSIDPVKGPLIRYLFERYATNTVSFEELRHDLAEKGLRAAAGKPLFPNTLTAILNNPFYMGVIRIGTTGETFPGAHEPLITTALFERVQAILRGKTVPKAGNHHFMLRQMVKCGACGRRTLTGERQKGHLYYRCHGRTCRGISWRGDVLEGVALDQISHIRMDDRDIRDLRDMVEDEYRSRAGDEERLKASLTLRLNHLDDRMTRLTDLLVDDVIDQPTFNARKEKLLLERRGILDELERADARSPLQELFEVFERNNRELLRYETLLDDEKRELIDIVCSNFSVHGESPAFTLLTPYKEIAEIDDVDECAHHRDDVRIRRILDTLKNMAEKKFDVAAVSNRPLQRPSSPQVHE
jgi:site-specific DNA recombinase